MEIEQWFIPPGLPMTHVVEMIEQRFIKLETYINELEKKLEVQNGVNPAPVADNRKLELS